MKVLCHINNMCRGGAERVMSVLIDSMTSDGTEVVLVTLDREAEEYEVPESVKRIEIDERISFGNAGTRFIKRVKALRDIIKEEEPDLVLSFCSKENVRCSLSMRGLSIPLLVSVRSNPIEHYSSRLLTKTIAGRADGWVFQSKDAQSYFGEKVSVKSRIITNPIDKKYFDVKADNCAEKDEIRIVTAGRISKPKNQVHLVNSFISIANKYPHAHLYIYGKDDKDGSSDAILKILQGSDCADRIHLMGACSNWADEIINSDIFVMTSVFEGMPNALMEAMVVGLPCISTDCPCGGPASLIEDGVNGRLVPMYEIKPLADAMEELINDRQKRIDFGREALKIRESVETGMVYRQWKDYMTALTDSK